MELITRPAHSDPRLIGLVAAGGALGTCCRALLSDAVGAPSGQWPWATFCINVVGAFVLSLLLETLIRRGTDSGGRRRMRLGGGTGFLGGFTTYSTFAVETLHLSPSLAVTYVVGTVAVGVLAAALGFVVADRLTPSRPAAV